MSRPSESNEISVGAKCYDNDTGELIPCYAKQRQTCKTIIRKSKDSSLRRDLQYHVRCYLQLVYWQSSALCRFCLSRVKPKGFNYVISGFLFVCLICGDDLRELTWMGSNLDRAILFSFCVNGRLNLVWFSYDSKFSVVFLIVWVTTIEGWENLRETGLGDLPCCGFLTTGNYRGQGSIINFWLFLSIPSLFVDSLLSFLSPDRMDLANLSDEKVKHCIDSTDLTYTMWVNGKRTKPNHTTQLVQCMFAEESHWWRHWKLGGLTVIHTGVK